MTASVDRGERVQAYLAWLAVNQKVSASTQNQASSAILFLYRRPPGKGQKDRLTVLPERVMEPGTTRRRLAARSRS